MELLPEDNESRPPKWTLIRDIAVLQVKLVVDGLRDLILVPASLVAGIISLSKTKDGVPGNELPPEVTEQNHFGDADIDDIVSRVESFVVDEYKRGGVTAQARDRMNKAMDAMRRRKEGQ
jgi:hypothetical protein